MQAVIFRHYDIRGKVSSELVLDEVYNLGCAIASFFLAQKPDLQTIALAMDGRVDSAYIKDELARAFLDAGINIVFVGLCPTPVLYFSQYHLPVDGGLMVTASHNGKEYNGIKMCLGRESIWGEDIQKIWKLYQNNVKQTAIKKGTYSEYELIPEYIAWLKNQFPHLVGMDLAVIADCGNGAAGSVMPQLIKAMEWKHVDLLFEQIDGTYPHHDADPVVEKNMQDVRKSLASGLYELGIGFDGDCDRMAAMTQEGVLIGGDQLLALYAQKLLADKRGQAIVFDIKCSSGLEELVAEWGGNPIVSASGHSVIKQAMKKHDAVLAGELSCHFFFKDRYFGYDDGMYAALRLFELLADRRHTFKELLSVFPHKFATPEIRLVCLQDQLLPIVGYVQEHFQHKKDFRVITVDGIKIVTDYGWGLLRASNTQPVLCLRFESNTQEGLCRLQETFIDVLKPFFNQTMLEQELIKPL